MHININTDAMVGYANKLEKMNKSSLPVTVRIVLNKAAFDVKQNTMPVQAQKHFIHRRPTFFKANSKVYPAQGFNINSMRSVVGFAPKAGTDKSVDDLEAQEQGGSIGGRSFIALKQARAGGSWAKTTITSARMGNVHNLVDSKRAKGQTDAQKFIKSAVFAGKNKLVVGTRTTGGGNRIVFRIRSISRKGKNTTVNSVPVFALKSGRIVKPKATRFMRSAAEQSGKKMQQYFIDEAKKRLL